MQHQWKKKQKKEVCFRSNPLYIHLAQPLKAHYIMVVHVT